ncbi:MAG: AAA family ATPase [Candidatus Omnitrophica bacterium]|nr:AAA family ATPase [Candidatus Omnitrophota bacterium]
MSYTIAVCGKGGTGKTTFSALLIAELAKQHQGEGIIAVDADPNANLDQALGLLAENSIVSIVDSISANPAQIPPGTTKDRFLEYQIQDSLAEADGFDLLVMGRPEGPGCYCFINNLLRTLIKKLTKSYNYMVIDNEAGMEHLSRRTARKIDLLFIVSDYSLVGLRSAKRILDLIGELKITVRESRLVINRATDGIEKLKAEIKHLGIPLAGVIPQDEEVAKISLENGNLKKLSQNSKAKQMVSKICKEVASGS